MGTIQCGNEKVIKIAKFLCEEADEKLIDLCDLLCKEFDPISEDIFDPKERFYPEGGIPLRAISEDPTLLV